MIKGARPFDRLGDLAPHRALEQRHDLATVGEAQHVANGGRAEALPAAERNRLIEQRERVAHRAFGDAGDDGERVRLDRNALGGADVRQMR